LPSTRHFFVSRLLVSGWLIVALSARGRHREISGSPTSAGIKRYILTTTASDATAETAQSDFSHSLGILCSAYQIALSTAFHHLVFDQMHDPPPSRASLIERSIARCGVAASR